MHFVFDDVTNAMTSSILLRDVCIFKDRHKSIKNDDTNFVFGGNVAQYVLLLANIQIES